MGTQGVKCTLTKSEVTEAIKKHDGMLTHAASDLHVCFTTLKNLVDADEELRKLVDDLRCARAYILTHAAEDTLKKCVTKVEADAPTALKASMYILNNLGRKMGYSHEQTKAVQEQTISQTQILKALSDDALSSMNDKS